MNRYEYLSAAIEDCLYRLYADSSMIKTTKWQGMASPAPMREVLFHSFEAPMQDTVENMVAECNPNLPWADLHFAERVGGQPLNPGETFKIWPFYKYDEKHRDNNVFSHTYMERFWFPKIQGLRYQTGNLGDVVELLRHERDTRQAFIPIWMPEDTGVLHGGRVPCTIGYHIIIRDGFLHVVYYIRSCDARRHLNDDVYLCNRLADWIRNLVDPNLKLGSLVMHITSLHVFESDNYWLSKKFKNY